MRYAIALEQKYSKDEILLGYLNIAGFGGTNYGVDAAARYYFGVAAKDLSLGQAAILAGMVQNPNSYRIDMPNGSMTDQDGNPVNSAADGYAKTKDRQVYVLDAPARRRQDHAGAVRRRCGRAHHPRDHDALDGLRRPPATARTSASTSSRS